MVYKNGMREYFMTTLLFGIPIGLLQGLVHRSILLGATAGIFCGVSFSLLLFLFVKIQEKKYDKKRLEIARERKIVCDGGATIQGNGGWLFLTDYGLEFYPHKINVSQKDLMISKSTIKSVKTNKNRLVVDVIDNTTIEFVVSHNKEWLEQMKRYIKANRLAT